MTDTIEQRLRDQLRQRWGARNWLKECPECGLVVDLLTDEWEQVYYGHDCEGDLMPCPVGELVGAPHSFTAGAGVVVPWSVMGDGRPLVTVCPSCAVNSVITDGTLDS
jgi:hypothetical protein